MNSFENIMEIGAFAPKEQMLHFQLYFQIHDISKGVKRHYYMGGKPRNYHEIVLA